MPMSETTFEEVFGGIEKIAVEVTAAGVFITNTETKSVVFVENTDTCRPNRSADRFFMLGTERFNLDSRKIAGGLMVVGKYDCYAAGEKLLRRLVEGARIEMDSLMLDLQGMKQVISWPTSLRSQVTGSVTFRHGGVLNEGHVNALSRVLKSPKQTVIETRWATQPARDQIKIFMGRNVRCIETSSGQVTIQAPFEEAVRLMNASAAASAAAAAAASAASDVSTSRQ